MLLKGSYTLTVGLLLVAIFFKHYWVIPGQTEEVKAHIEEFLAERVEEKVEERVALGDIDIKNVDITNVNPFGKDDRTKILLIGLDTRIGSTESHCDAIQLIDVNKKTSKITITAVPRGTYAPLPGGPHDPGAYYVSNSCAVGGISYGIGQIERILGQKADYVVFVGFGEALGIFERLQLPTTETLQWLRHRQGYAIGEPQRARNHSTFIKQMIGRFVPEDRNSIDTAWYYMLYRLGNSDLTFEESMSVLDAISAMDIKNHPERITLAMQPAYDVVDIPYNEETANKYVKSLVDPIKRKLSTQDYQAQTENSIEANVLKLLKEHEADEPFLISAFEQKVWFQIKDEDMADAVRYHLLTIYLSTEKSSLARQEILAEFIIEMEHLQKEHWTNLAREVLEEELNK